MTLFQRLSRPFQASVSAATKRFRTVRSRTTAYINKNPVRSFYISLGIFILLILLSNIVGNSKPKEKPSVEIVKDVEEFSIGTVPKIKVIAKVEKSGVISVTALTPGVVKYIKSPVGTKVARGQNLLGLSTNYQGGNASTLSRQLAEVQYKNASENRDLQHELVKKQKEIAEKVDVNADELRKVTDLSIGETQDLVNLTNDILTQLDTSIANLEATNVGGTNDALILSTKELKSQFLAVRNGASQGMRMAIYNVDQAHPPAQLSDLQRDLTLKQLELQDKMIDVNVEVARLQLSLAKVAEGMMYPASPISGTVERVGVKVGQSVNPGMELMVISGESGSMPTRANVFVSENIARRVSMTDDSVLVLNNGVTLKARPYYVSREAVEGNLAGVYYLIPPEFAKDTTEGGFVSVELPIGYAQTTATVPFVPIDAVYQSKEASTIFVDAAGVATGKTVRLGNVTGSFVEVTSGLAPGDAVILSRTVISGDKVKRVGP